MKPSCEGGTERVQWRRPESKDLDFIFSQFPASAPARMDLEFKSSKSYKKKKKLFGVFFFLFGYLWWRGRRE